MVALKGAKANKNTYYMIFIYVISCAMRCAHIIASTDPTSIEKSAYSVHMCVLVAMKIDVLTRSVTLN